MRRYLDTYLARTEVTDNGEMATLAASGVTAAAAVYSCGAAARMEAVRSARTLATSTVTRASILDVSVSILSTKQEITSQNASHHRLMKVTFCEAVLLLLDWNSLMHHNRGFLSRETGLWLVRVIIHLSLRYLSLSTIYYPPTSLD